MSLKRSALVASATAAALMAAATAQAATIDFSTPGGNGNVILASDLFNVLSLTVDSAGSEDTLITFNTNLASAEDPDLVAPFDDPNTVGFDNETGLGSIAIISESATYVPPDDEATGGKVTFVFDKLVTLKSTTFVDTKSGTVTLLDIDGVPLTINPFDIPDVDTDDTTNPNQFSKLVYGDISGVKTMIIELGESGGFDNIVFQPVPVPAALPLFLAGVGGLVVARRKRQA